MDIQDIEGCFPIYTHIASPTGAQAPPNTGSTIPGTVHQYHQVTERGRMAESEARRPPHFPLPDAVPDPLLDACGNLLVGKFTAWSTSDAAAWIPMELRHLPLPTPPAPPRMWGVDELVGRQDRAMVWQRADPHTHKGFQRSPGSTVRPHSARGSSACCHARMMRPQSAPTERTGKQGIHSNCACENYDFTRHAAILDDATIHRLRPVHHWHFATSGVKSPMASPNARQAGKKSVEICRKEMGGFAALQHQTPCVQVGAPRYVCARFRSSAAAQRAESSRARSPLCRGLCSRCSAPPPSISARAHPAGVARASRPRWVLRPF